MSLRITAEESAHIRPVGVSGGAQRRLKKKLAGEDFFVEEDFALREGYLYTVTRAISARVNQNYDGWPAAELAKAAHTFVGKPVFVNHENHDPTLARGRVVAARYVENGDDRYIEVVQEIDAERFPRLAKEIRTGGLDSVSMGAEAGFTVCSYCNNRATDMAEMCDHVLHHKGEKLRREGKNGQYEDVLVYESCHDVKFFELSYVFDPADETAVVSKVVQAAKSSDALHKEMKARGHLAGKYTKEDFAVEDGKKPWERDHSDDEAEPKIAGIVEDYTDVFFGEPLGDGLSLPPESLGDRYMDEMYNEDMHLDGPGHTAAVRRTGAKVNWLIDPNDFDPNEPVHVHTMRHHVKRGIPEIWSIAQKGPNGQPRVIAYADEVPMRDVRFRVQPAGNALYQRTMDEKGEKGERNVHAWADGYWVPELPGELQNESAVDYHPSGPPNFWHVDDSSPVSDASFVHFRPDKKVLAYSPDNWGRPARVAALEPMEGQVEKSWHEATIRWLENPAQAGQILMTATSAYTREYLDAVAQELINWYDSRDPEKNVYDFMHEKASNPAEVGNARPYVEMRGRNDIYPGLLEQVQKAASWLRLGYGEIEAPEDVDTLRNEDEEEEDFQHFLEPPPELQAPDLDESKRLDREQEIQGLDIDRRAEDAEELQPGQELFAPRPDEQSPQSLTLNLPLPQARRKAERINYSSYLPHAVKNAQKTSQEMNTQQKGNVMGSLAERGKTASRKQHHADMSRNDQGEQEEVFVTQTPPEEAVVAPSDDAANISNTPSNLVARIRAASESLKRDIATYQAMTKRADDTPVKAEVHDPPLSGTDEQSVTDGSFVNPDPNAGVVPTQPKDASRAFQAFDKWLSQAAGVRMSQLSSSQIRRAASRYSSETGTPIDSLFPALGTVLRAARKNEAAHRRSPMPNRTADTSLDVAAPDGRVDVEAPVSNTTDDDAQASQYETGDYGKNAGDSVADPDLSTTQNFAPGEGRSAKKADGVLAVRCAEAYINAGLAEEGDKWKLAGQFQTMNRGLVQSHVALLERVASVHATRFAKVASGKTRGTARLPQGITNAPGTARTAATTRQAFNDPSYDFTLFTG